MLVFKLRGENSDGCKSVCLQEQEEFVIHQYVQKYVMNVKGK